MHAISLAFTPDLRPLRRPGGGGGTGNVIRRVAGLGDSLVNAWSGIQGANYEPAWKITGALGYAAAILGQPFCATRNPRAMNGAPHAADLDFGWDGITAADYVSSATVIEAKAVEAGNTGWTPAETRTPLAVAMASGPDAYVMLIGTNDVGAATAEATLARIDAMARALRAGGAVVFIGALLPRTTSGYQAKIDAVNAALPALAEAAGCVLVPWHVPLMSGGSQIRDYFADETHPNQGGACRMGVVLAERMAPFVGPPLALPAADSPRWLTANSDMAADTDEDGKADGIDAYNFSAGVFDLVASGGRIWQEMTETDAESVAVKTIYGASVAGAPVAALVASGAKVRGVCRYEVVSGTVGTVAMFVRAATAGYVPLRYSGYYDGTRPLTPFLQPHSGLMLSEPMAFPATSALGHIAVVFAGTGTIRVTDFGILAEP